MSNNPTGQRKPLRVSKYHYTVYPKHERVRSFRYLEAAKRFASIAFSRQGLTNLDEVVIVGGDNSVRKVLGKLDVTGWHDVN